MAFRCKILVIEDDPATREMMEGILREGANYDVITADNGADAEILANSHCPDVILLDLGLPDIDGTSVLRNVRNWSEVPVIVVSARNDEYDKVQALENGADDYVQKPICSTELLARIRVALRHSHIGRSSVCSDSKLKIGNLVIDFMKYRVYVNGEDAKLTQNEFKLVSMLAQYAGQVLPYEDIIRRMWGPNARADNQILRVNMTNIRRKIEKDPSHPQYIVTENGIGYLMAEIPPDTDPDDFSR
ncbi:MAG: response regulator transcription factor [Oscillospiraceae bacterium]